MFRFISQQAQIVRSYYSGIGKEQVLYPAAFGVSLAISLLVLGVVFYARDILHLSASVVGQLACVHTMTYTVGCIALRPLLRRTPPRYLIIGSNLLMAASIFGLTYATSAGWAFVFYGCFGLSMALFWPRAMGWLSVEKEGSELGKVTSRFNISWASAAIISPYLCGRLLEISRLLPLQIAAGIFLLVAAFVAGASAVLPRIRNDRSQDRLTDNASGEDHSTPLRFPAWIGLFATHFGAGVLVSVFPLAARDGLGMPERTIGLLLLIPSLTNTIGFLFLGRFHFWQFRLLPIILPLLVRAVTFGGMMVAASLGPLAFLMVFLGLTASVTYSASIFHGASGSPDRARRMAIHESLIAGGFVAGSVIGGFSFQYGSVALTYAITVAVGLVAVGLQCWVARKHRQPTPDAATP